VSHCELKHISDAPRAFPHELAGRELYAITDRYTLYGFKLGDDERDGWMADLKAWIDVQLPEIQALYGRPDYPGVVLAGNAAEERYRPLSEWRTKTRPRRAIHWTHPNRSQEVHSSERPYCLQSSSYAREAYLVPLDDATSWGMLDANMPRVSWICVIGTARQFETSFDAEVARIDAIPIPEAHLANLAGLLHAGFVAALKPAVRHTQRKLDRALMNLQRHEALAASVIAATYATDHERLNKLADLQLMTDREWQAIFFRRPLD